MRVFCLCEAERCSADMRDRSCVSAAVAAAASDADGSAVVSLEHRQGWAPTEEGGGGEKDECDPGGLEMTRLIAPWLGGC